MKNALQDQAELFDTHPLYDTLKKVIIDLTYFYMKHTLQDEVGWVREKFLPIWVIL